MASNSDRAVWRLEVLDKPVTWHSVVRVGLIWGAEYALLSLIEDAPAWFKLATIGASLAALAALEWKTKLDKVWRYSFPVAIIGLLAIYGSCIGYAYNEHLIRVSLREHLLRIYSSSRELSERTIPLDTKTKANLDQPEVTRFRNDFRKWEKNAADWIEKHLGPAAREQFLDRGNMPSLVGWGENFVDSRYDQDRNFLSSDRHNLFLILESRTYVK